MVRRRIQISLELWEAAPMICMCKKIVRKERMRRNGAGVQKLLCLGKAYRTAFSEGGMHKTTSAQKSGFVGQRKKALPLWAMRFAPAFPFGADDNLGLALILEGDPI